MQTGVLPTVNVTNPGVQTLTIGGGALANTVTVNGTSGIDTINVVKGATTTVQVNTFQTISLPSTSNGNVVVAAGDGADTINVSGTTANGQILNVKGGEPGTIDPAVSDSLNITMVTAGTTDVNEGASPDTGSVFSPDGTTEFSGIEAINLTGTGADTVEAEATDGNDTIALSNDAGVVGGNEYYINNAAIIAFQGYSTANINY